MNTVRLVKRHGPHLVTDADMEAIRIGMRASETRAAAATSKGADALERLLTLAENRDSGQVARIARFIGGCWNGHRHFDLFELRAVDESISDDMLAVLDALRWARADIGRMVTDGERRIQSMLQLWGMYGPEQSGQLMASHE